MADALVSALVSTILGNLNSLALKQLGLARDLETELQELKSTLRTLNAVLHDAEKKQWKSEVVKDWLRQLKDVAYDAADVLDEFAIEVQRHGLQGDLKSQVRSFFSLNNPLIFPVIMAKKVKNVREKLDAIAKGRRFHLTEGDGNTEVDSSDWRQTSSFVNELEIYGRDKEKQELISLLLNNSGDLSVYAICGMGGLGKTTLAQLVYNDGDVGRYFDKRIWICVSDDFDIIRLTRAIVESIEGNSCTIQQLDPLQRRLQEKLSGKKFLLILDDVWDDYHDKWIGLNGVLKCGAKGSVVIVTTRIETVAHKMATVPIHYIGRLSDDDSWSLFEGRAFGMRVREEFARLEPIGKDIVKKCGGVPLAIKALGSLMRSKLEESEWLSVKESEIWDLPDEGSTILPALRLSYDNLPPHMRQCFAFCSIFPKDYEMEKEKLIQLWIANDFIPSRGQMDLHDIGCDIFNGLVWRSFLQDVKDNWRGETVCQMHDLVHDLALSIMTDDSHVIESNKKLEVPNNARYLTVLHSSSQTPQMDLSKVQSLRSLLFLDSQYPIIWPSSYFSKQKHLRSLDLSGSCFYKCPKSIFKLRHLRYLDVSYSDIQTLPESICSLQNLQTLNMRYCYNLCILPKSMKNLKKLKYLDITDCREIKCMPPGMGQLTGLRKLSIFIVGKDDGHYIRELKELNLGGELSIKGLCDVKNLTDAKSANLMGKKNLQSLALCWGENDNSNIITNASENSEVVLCGLQPHSNMKKLQIIGYGGLIFPNWMMELLLPSLVEVSLEGCNRCEHLPPFGKLQLLRDLSLSKMDVVKCITCDVYGDEENPFPSLERLRLHSMPNLEGWEVVARRNVFLSLIELAVICCPKLVELPIIPSVKKLEIRQCSEMLLRSVVNFTFLTHLWIDDSQSTLLPAGVKQNHKHLQHLDIWMSSLQSLSNELDNLSALKSLRLICCRELGSLPEGLQSLKSLETLQISCCGLTSLPFNALRDLSSLRSLTIRHCDKFASLSEGVGYLASLEDLEISGCPVNSLPESIQHLTALRRLVIGPCEGLSSLPNQIGCLSSLSSLWIEGCPYLMSLPQGVRDLKTLRELRIYDCPNLERRCRKGRGEDWPKIACIPMIKINGQLMQSVDCEEVV